jgi:hypothetical protein
MRFSTATVAILLQSALVFSQANYTTSAAPPTVTGTNSTGGSNGTWTNGTSPTGTPTGGSPSPTANAAMIVAPWGVSMALAGGLVAALL